MKYIMMAFIFMCSCTSTKTSDADCKGLAKKDCMCTMQYDPVCGCDKKTYSNACVAGCEGIKSFTKGACPP